MALILKAGSTITNPQTGAEFNTAYAVVNHVENNKRQKSQVIRVAIYIAQGDHVAKRRPIVHPLAVDYYVTGQDWIDYFAVAQQTPAGKNLYKQSYLWLLQATDETGTTLLFEDWESDE